MSVLSESPTERTSMAVLQDLLDSLLRQSPPDYAKIVEVERELAKAQARKGRSSE